MTSVIYFPGTTNNSLEGSQVVNLLHSGFNVTSNNSTSGQNLVITKPQNIEPNTKNQLGEFPTNNLTPLLLFGGVVLLAVVLLK